MPLDHLASVVVLTGPAAAGKNHVAHAITGRMDAIAIIDVDVVRHMLVKPHVAPWGGEEGRKQQELGVKNASQLARNFAEAGIPVLLLDVITDRTSRLYREHLAGIDLHIVLLLPDWSAVEKRFIARGPGITLDEAKLTYEWQRELKEFDLRIDNTSSSHEDVTDQLVPLLSGAS